MDYENFKKEFKKYNKHDWTNEDKKYQPFEEWTTDENLESVKKDTTRHFPNLNMYNQDKVAEGRKWLRVVEGYDAPKDTPIDEEADRVLSNNELYDKMMMRREPIDEEAARARFDEEADRVRAIREDIERFKLYRVPPVDNDGNFYQPEAQNDMVNSPAHYTRGSQECIDTIEEAIQDAPDPIVGALQYQVLKYILRIWLKDNALQDSKKARWYLNRLISKLEE